MSTEQQFCSPSSAGDLVADPLTAQRWGQADAAKAVQRILDMKLGPKYPSANASSPPPLPQGKGPLARFDPHNKEFHTTYMVSFRKHSVSLLLQEAQKIRSVIEAKKEEGAAEGAEEKELDVFSLIPKLDAARLDLQEEYLDSATHAVYVERLRETQQKQLEAQQVGLGRTVGVLGEEFGGCGEESSWSLWNTAR